LSPATKDGGSASVRVKFQTEQPIVEFFLIPRLWVAQGTRDGLRFADKLDAAIAALTRTSERAAVKKAATWSRADER